MLDTQVHVYSLDTSYFYSNRETRLHNLNCKLKHERNELINKIKRESDILKEYGFDNGDFSSILSGEYDHSGCGNDEYEIRKSAKKYHTYKHQLHQKKKKIKKTKDDLLHILKNKVNANILSKGKHHIRQLNEDKLSDKDKISVFSSVLTRMIGAEQNQLTDDFMVIQVFFFDVIKDLINFGFMYKGKRYIYFTSSAGQIRKKKCVFIKESVWKKYEKTIMCGLSIESINAQGGCNPNKYLAYLALTNSATDVWEEFDIDKSIVIDDFETQVHGTYDLIDDHDYSITRTSGCVPVPHTDGAGMILPQAFGVGQRNRIIRLPWIKGLLGVFDFKKFIEVNNCSPTIKDIYGEEHDVVAEDIQIIFTKSQFKMYRYYSSWHEYKEFYKKYGCSAGYTSIEESRICDSRINYQMLQTLTDITDDEIKQLISPSNDEIIGLCDSIESMQNALGISPYNTHKTAFQKSIELYPDLLNDMSIKAILKDIKDSMVKRSRSGKLKLHGKYTFVLPDFYAACEYWFEDIKDPKGLLDDGEVFCWLFRNSEKLDCLRSPHLYREHAVRKNLAYRDHEKQKDLREWFVTDAVYTSTHDLISKLLMFDVDGDALLVVADKLFIEIAERNMKGIVPLYYNMRKADAIILDDQSIYGGLCAAFTGGNIGIYSNNISKIWNDEVFISGSSEDKKHAMDCIKRLCAQNNFVIDQAKTLYKPEFPKHIQNEIKEFTNKKLPHFFIYAKDKDISQVENTNSSFVNKLENMVSNPRINCRKVRLGKIDHELMMIRKYKVDFKVSYFNNGKLDKEKTEPLIVKYLESSKNCYYRINYERVNELRGDILKNSVLRQSIMFNDLIIKTKTELSKFGYNDEQIVNILVEFLYNIKPNKSKALLWNCYGDIIYDTLTYHVKPKVRAAQCVDCGEWFYVPFRNRRACCCDECKDRYFKESRKISNKKYYNKIKTNSI